MTDVDTVVAYGTVIGRFVQYLPDSGDVGTVPDESPLTGTVTLKPLIDVSRWPTANPPRMGVTREVECPVVDGELTSPDGAVGVSLVATDQPNAQPDIIQWRADFNFKELLVQPNPVVFNVNAGEITDLSLVESVSVEPPVVLVVSHSDRLAAEAAAASAESAAASASNSAANSAASASDAEEALDSINSMIINPEQYNAVGNGIADDTIPVLAAAAAVSATKRAGLGGNIYTPEATLRLTGRYNLASLVGPIIVEGNLEATDGATLIVPANYADITLFVGLNQSGKLLYNADIFTPTIEKASGVSSLVPGSVAIKAQNLYHSRFYARRQTQHETGVWLSGLGQGFAYNEVHFGWTDLCKVSWKIAPETGGWVNQNNYIGGGITQSPNNYDGGSTTDRRRPGYRHLVIDGSGGAAWAPTVDGSTFYGVSCEGFLSEFNFDIKQADRVEFLGITRFETGDTGTACTVSGDTITANGHGLSVGDMVAFVVSGSRPGGMITGASERPGYYITAADTNTFKVSETLSGATVTFTSAGAGVMYIVPARIRLQGVERMALGKVLTWPGPVDVRYVDQPRDIYVDPPRGVQGDLMPGRNRIINGDFRINQRGYVSAAFLTSGTYCFDRWKSNSAGTQVTFTASPQGQLVTVGGTIAQVLERANVEAGKWTLSWKGYATGRVYRVGDTAPSYASSPITVDLDGTTDVIVEFLGGGEKVGLVQFERGPLATPFERVPITTSLIQCKRYFQRFGALTGAQVRETLGVGAALTTTSAIFGLILPVEMRITPTLSIVGSIGTLRVNDINSIVVPTACVLAGTPGSQSTPKALRVAVTAAAGFTPGHAVYLDTGDSNACVDLSSEL